MSKGQEYEAFISHNGEDTHWAERLAEKLHAAGLKVFLDKWCLTPGAPWQPEIDEALRSSQSYLILVGPHGVGPWQHVEMRAAIDLQSKTATTGSERTRGRPVIPVLLPGSSKRPARDDLPLFLRENTWVEFDESLDEEGTFDRLLAGIRSVPPVLASPGVQRVACPYRALEAFQVEHAHLFFGREAATEWCLDKLRPARTVAQTDLTRENRFLAVVGPSGSGKSSLVRAGLLSYLRDRGWFRGGAGSSRTWDYRLFRPGPDPIGSLTAELTALAPPQVVLPVPREMAAELMGDGKALQAWLQRFLAGRGDHHRVVFVVDQFEEVFTVCEKPEVRQAFLQNLLHASTIYAGKAIVVVALRADFLGRCAEHPQLAAVVADHQEIVSPLSENELRDAIERPAQLAGCEVEPGLVEILLRDASGQAGLLPLLQLALTRLWERKEGAGKLTLDAYEEIGKPLGGLEGVLEQHANAVYEDLRADEKAICRRVLQQLTKLGEGAEDTKRREPLEALLPAQGDRRAVMHVIETLTDRRLLTKGLPAEGVEVAHEALIRHWSKLRAWINEDRHTLRFHAMLASAAREWRERKEDESYLWPAERSAELEGWLRGHAQELNAELRAFIDRSLEKRDRERREEAERQHQEAKTTRRLRVWAAGAVALALVVVGMMLLADHQQFLARRHLSSTHLLQARAHGESDRPLQALHSYWRAYDAADERDEARRGARNLIGATAGAVGTMLLHDDTVTAIAFSPDGKTAATASVDHTARLWDVPSGKARGLILRHGGTVMSVAFSPDGTRVATASGDHTARLWDARMGEPRSGKLQHALEVRNVAFSPNGQLVATASADQSARLWDVATGTMHGQPLKHEGGVRVVAFSPVEGKTLATGSYDRTARLWDVETATQTFKFSHSGEVLSVAFDPAGTLLATGCSDGTLRVWQVSTGALQGKLMRHQDAVYAIAFAPQRDILLSVSDDRTAQFWDVATCKRLREPLQHEREVRSVAFSPDGETVVTGGHDKVARLWNTRNSKPVGSPLTHEGAVWAVAFAPGGQTLLTCGGDDTARLWPMSGRNRDGFRLSHSMELWTAVCSSDGRVLATGGQDGTAKLWKVESGEQLARDLVHDGDVYAVAFSPDGATVATGSKDATARLWSVATGEPRGPPLKHEGPVVVVAISPDGETIATGSHDKTARLWAVSDGVSRCPPMPHDEVVRVVAFSPDGRCMVTGSEDDSALLWEVPSGNPRGLPLEHHGDVHAAVFSPDGKLVATGSDDATARLWDAGTGKPLRQVFRHRRFVRFVVFSPDGTTLATAGNDDTAQLWDVATGVARGEPLRHANNVLAIAFNPDSELVATGSRDGIARIWDTRSGIPLGEPLKHGRELKRLYFSVDGRTLVTVSGSKVVHRWPIAPPALDDPERLQLSVEVRSGWTVDASGASRRLTQAEWLERQRRLFERFGGPCDAIDGVAEPLSSPAGFVDPPPPR